MVQGRAMVSAVVIRVILASSVTTVTSVTMLRIRMRKNYYVQNVMLLAKGPVLKLVPKVY